MDIPQKFFRSAVRAIREEVERLCKSRILDCEHNRPEKGRGDALGCILYEDALRLLALRNFYETEDTTRIRFHAECGWKCEDACLASRRIDLVLIDGENEYAFELKRWYEKGLTKGLTKDHQNLADFVKMSPALHGYEVLFSIVENKGQGQAFEQDKRARLGSDFENGLGTLFSRADLEVLEFESFTIAVYLAQPKPAAAAAECG